MSHQDDAALRLLLQQEWEILQTSAQTLHLSFDKCKAIGIKKIYSFEEQESFDSLTSKFNRTSDLYTQKVLRTTWMLLHEAFVPFIDRMNKAEKDEIISSAENLIAIRDLRNQIAHEYIPQAIQDLIPEVMEFIQILEINMKVTADFLQKRAWINS